MGEEILRCGGTPVVTDEFAVGPAERPELHTEECLVAATLQGLIDELTAAGI